MAYTDKQQVTSWKEFAEGIRNSTPIDTTELSGDKLKRIAMLESDPEAWFAYYFPKYSQKPDGTPSPPAPFHLAATKRVIAHAEWTEVRNWARELAKSTRTMMEVMYLVLVGNPVSVNKPPKSAKNVTVSKVERRRKRNVLCVSNSLENATRLLAPYKVNFESNNRIINDYGDQENIGSWTDTEFITKKGVAFRAIGAGQSPRGTRNEAIRPDVILVDDIDTDEDCRNSDIIDKRWDWIQEALIPTRSISNPLLVIWCGNIIAEDCCVVRAAERADKVDVVNIRDDQGKSTWPTKNSEADIERVLSAISYAAYQKEYFNNPMSTGRTFPEITWGKCPPLSQLRFATVYADPATSNTDKPGQKSNLLNSRKAVFIIGYHNDKYYIYSGFLDVMSQANFIAAFYECRNYIGGKTNAYYVIENNTLQDPFFQQVILPRVFEYAQLNKVQALSLTPDPRDKKDKWFRIEGTLEPLNRMGKLIFNEDEKTNPHMLRLEAQFKAAKPNSKQLDGPDCIEGGVFIINQKAAFAEPDSVRASGKSRNPKKY